MNQPIQWGSARRGRNWHLLKPATSDRPTTGTLCGREIELRQFLDGMPPRGGTPCPDCGDAVRELANTFRAALGQSGREDSGETLDSDADIA